MLFPSPIRDNRTESVRQFSISQCVLFFAPQRTFGHDSVVLELRILGGRQQILAPRFILNIEADHCLSVIGYKVELRVVVNIASGFRKARKCIDGFTVLVDMPLVCEATPGESAVFEFDLVTLVGHARWRIKAIDTRTAA